MKQSRDVAVLALAAFLGVLCGCAPVVRGKSVSATAIPHSFKLVVWNPSSREARLSIRLENTVIFDETVRPPHVDPAIVAFRYAALPVGDYQLVVTDRSTGQFEAVTIHLTRYINVDVRVEANGVKIDVSTTLRDGYA